MDKKIVIRSIDTESKSGFSLNDSEFTVDEILAKLPCRRNNDGEILVKYKRLNVAGTHVGWGECIIDDLPHHVDNHYGELVEQDHDTCPVCGKAIFRSYEDSYIESFKSGNVYCCEEHLLQTEPDCNDFG